MDLFLHKDIRITPLQTSIYSPNKVQKVRYTNKNYGVLWMLLNYIYFKDLSMKEGSLSSFGPPI
jgi:hypothetical protein